MAANTFVLSVKTIYWISANGIMGFLMYDYLGVVGHWLFNLKYSFIFEIKIKLDWFFRL